jgi:hypothetical protein
MGRPQRREVLDELMQRIRCLERAECQTQWAATVSSGFATLDRLLPDKGFVGGTLVEWLSEGLGTGAMTLAVAISGKLIRAEGMLVVVDPAREFFPPAAAGLGVPLERTIVVQPGDLRTQWWALEQALLSGAVTVTLGRIEKANERVLRRWLLAVEKGGGLGFLIRPAAEPALGAHLRFRVTTLSGTKEDGWRLQVESLAVRGATAGGKAVVELGG